MNPEGYVRGEGNPRAKLMIVADYPSKADVENGRPFSGFDGVILDNFLREAGISRADTYLTHVLKIRPDVSTAKRLNRSHALVEHYTPQLVTEIRTIKPNVILTLGELPLNLLTNKVKIQYQRGSILQTVDGANKVVPTYHPNKLVRIEGEDSSVFQYSARVYIQQDFVRAVEESRSPEYRIPHRDLLIAKNSLDVWRYINANKGLLSVDIESLHCICSCVAIANNSHSALCLPLRNRYSPRNPQGMSDRELVAIWKMLAGIMRDPNVKKIGQNFKFDQEKLAHLRIRTENLAYDTMLMAHTLHPELPQNLAWLTSVYTREPYYKDEGKEFDIKKDKIDRLYFYNAKDAAVTFEIYEALRAELESENLWSFYVDEVHPRHQLYVDMERIGIRIDEHQRKMLQGKYDIEDKLLSEKLAELVGHEVNVNSPRQMAQLLYTELRCPLRAGTDEDTLVALMNNAVKDEKRKEILRLILRIRRVKKTKSTYIYAPPDYDGRMRTSHRITGTETGRSSTTNLAPPLRPQTIIKVNGKPKVKARGLAFQTMTKHGDVGNDLRSMFIPDDGYLFVNVDLSQAEARIVALLSDDTELLELFKTRDVHTMTAAMIQFGDKNQVEKITSDMRFIGKEARHAGNYDIGKRRFMFMVNSDAKKFNIPVEISEWRGGQILESFHAMHPKVKSVFHASIRRLLDEDGVIVNPFGRKRQFFDRQGDSQYKEGYAQIPQSTVRDHMCRAMVAIKKRLPDTQYLIEAHDAFLAQVPRGEEADRILIYKEELEREIDFKNCSIPRGTLRIPSDAEVGENYKDLKRWKSGARS